MFGAAVDGLRRWGVGGPDRLQAAHDQVWPWRRCRGQNSRATFAPASAASPMPAVAAPLAPAIATCDTAPAAACPDSRPAAGTRLPVLVLLVTTVLANACPSRGATPLLFER